MNSKRNHTINVASIFMLCLFCAAIVSGCTIFRHTKTAHKGSATGPAPDVQPLISALQQHFRTVTTFHVAMQVQNAGPPDPGQVQILSADGDVVMPDKVKAQAAVILSG